MMNSQLYFLLYIIRALRNDPFSYEQDSLQEKTDGAKKANKNGVI